MRVRCILDTVAGARLACVVFSNDWAPEGAPFSHSLNWLQPSFLLRNVTGAVATNHSATYARRHVDGGIYANEQRGTPYGDR